MYSEVLLEEIRNESREQLIGHLLCVFVPDDPDKRPEEIQQRRRDYVHNVGWDNLSTDDLRRVVYPTAA